MGIAAEFGPAAFTILAERRTLQCPAGQTLAYVRHSKKDGNDYHQYQAQGSDCSQSEF